jgi:paraquat-inducible protein B
MNPPPKARIERQSSFSFVWLIPLLCLAMVVLFAYRRYQSMGPLITIRFDNAESIVPDKTMLKYLGVVVGKVTGVAIDDGKVAVQARLERSAAAFARKGTVFIIVRPEVSFKGVAGLTTIFAGSSIDLRPGDGEPSLEFKGYGDSASLRRDEPGLRLNLTSPRISSIQAGDSVSYRGITVGAVTEAELDRTGQAVLIRIKVEERFGRFVRTNSKFWEASGIHAKLGLFGGNISVDSLQAFVKGGIAFATPDKPAERAKSGADFVLYPQAEPAWEK